MTGFPEGSTESGFMEKPGIEPSTPGLQDIDLSPTPRRLVFWSLFCGFSKKKTYCVAFPWVVTSTGPRGFMICVFIILRELPKAQPKAFSFPSLP